MCKKGVMVMRVAVFTDLLRTELQDRPKPEVGVGDVLVKVEYCGICGSDIHSYRNGSPTVPGTVMGHECSGVVAKVGSGVKGVGFGDQVVVKPFAQCNECYWCQRGQYSLCPTQLDNAIGLSPECDGAFAEYVRIQHPEEMLFKLPPNVSLKDAPLVEPLATSLHSVRLSRFKPGDSAVVIGAGAIGMGVLQFLKLGGAGKIIVLEISEEKASICRKLGADVVLNPNCEREGLQEEIQNLTDGIGADIVYECAGVPFSFKNSINFVRRGGQVMFVGVVEKEVPISNLEIIIKEVEMKGVLGYYDEFKHVIQFLDKGSINTDFLISDIISLNDLDAKGFKRLASSHDCVKILVRP
jgi:threonine dehydrogenase-like Zn-dependent dehydrogenase